MPVNSPPVPITIPLVLGFTLSPLIHSQQNDQNDSFQMAVRGHLKYGSILWLGLLWPILQLWIATRDQFDESLECRT